jgi:DNA-binding CsgD family transcriptional regulator
MPQVIAAVQRVCRLVKVDKAAGLTPREKEVLSWVSEGLTSKAIALQLGISYRTVEHYLADIQRKLGVSNRQQAVARAVNLSLVAPVPLLDGMTCFVSAGKECYHQKPKKQQ